MKRALRLGTTLLLLPWAACSSHDKIGSEPGGNPDVDSGMPVEDPDAGASGPSQPLLRTLTGYVTDAAQGLPVAQAQVSTVPPTETVFTSDEGFFALQIGQSYGVLEVHAELEGFSQREARCVTLRDGLNVADVDLHRLGASECDPACAAGEDCLSGRCAAACDPVCACGEVCSSAGLCEPAPDAPGVQCGANSEWTGGLVCTCNDGYALSTEEAACVEVPTNGHCPFNTILTDRGCECPGDLFLSHDGQSCVTAEDALNPPLRLKEVVRVWPAPGLAPRGLAYDGGALWIIDAVTEAAQRVRYTYDQDEPEILRSVDIGEVAYHLIDTAFSDGSLYMVANRPENGMLQEPLFLALRPDDTLEELPMPTQKGVPPVGVAMMGEDLITLADKSIATCSIYLVMPNPEVRLLAFFRNRTLTWSGSAFDGTSALATIMTFQAGALYDRVYGGCMGPTFTVPVHGTTLTGLDAAGDRLWVISAGDATAGPQVVEARFE